MDGQGTPEPGPPHHHPPTPPLFPPPSVPLPPGVIPTRPPGHHVPTPAGVGCNGARIVGLTDPMPRISAGVIGALEVGGLPLKICRIVMHAVCPSFAVE